MNIEIFLNHLKVHTQKTQSDPIGATIVIMPLGVRNINTILLIFMKINLQTTFYRWVRT